MNDRELLELAAKAAGIDLEWDGDPREWQAMYYAGKTYHIWNPLTDDGDALRLAVKLRMPLDFTSHAAFAREIRSDFRDSDPYAATRRAIVRAAAAMGEMK